MKTISETQNKNLNMEVKGDFYKYPDGTDFVVQNGKMTPVDGSGGGVLVITGTYNDGSTTQGTVDKTDAEILEAIAANSTVFLRLSPTEGATLDLLCIGHVAMSGQYGFYFISPAGKSISPVTVTNGTFIA